MYNMTTSLFLLSLQQHQPSATQISKLHWQSHCHYIMLLSGHITRAWVLLSGAMISRLGWWLGRRARSIRSGSFLISPQGLCHISTFDLQWRSYIMFKWVVLWASTVKCMATTGSSWSCHGHVCLFFYSAKIKPGPERRNVMISYMQRLLNSWYLHYSGQSLEKRSKLIGNKINYAITKFRHQVWKHCGLYWQFSREVNSFV